MRLPALTAIFVLFALSPTVADEFDAKKLPPAQISPVDFVKQVQPILRKSCYSCHGAEKQEGGLRLDLRQRAMDGGDSGPSIVAGKSAASRFIHLVAGLDEDSGIMPPDGEGTPLTKADVGLLRGWIDQGAKWPDSADSSVLVSNHWSFQPVTRPEIPKTKNSNWVRNPIDAFVLKRLEAKGIAPSPAADPSMLMRRLFLDLLGLPPSADEVHQFLNESRDAASDAASDEAYGRLVDRVLKSEHFGERWGRHWLDLARYADSDGYEKDRPRPHAWRYRDWVINAINRDMPFDRFTVEQIAGDMLPGAAVEQQIATGFHRNTLHNTEGGTDKEEDRVKKTVDRTNTAGSIWLGLTVGCAQCHTHKYDPISQREYYSLYAFFNSINEADVPAPLANEAAAYAEAKSRFDAEQARLKAAVSAYETSQLAKAQSSWEKTAARQVAWSNVVAESLLSRHGAELKTQQDGSVLASGPNQTSDVYTIHGKVDLPRLTALRLEVLPDKSLTKGGPGRADNGNFVLTTLRAAVEPLAGDDEIALSFASAQADFSQQDWEVEKAINDNTEDGWAVSPEFNKRHVAVFKLKEPVDFGDASRLIVTLDQAYNQPKAHNIGRFRLSATSSTGPIDLNGLPENVARVLPIDRKERTAEQTKAVADYFRSIDPELAKLQAAVKAHAGKAPKPSDKKAQAVVEVSTPRETRIHIRGDFLNKGSQVAIGTPAVLPKLNARADRPDRLDYAHWLVADDNPLTARVTVNRIWQRYFGRGIVSTSDDFGSQGERPTHPELLDWLAAELREHNWGAKHIHRLIVTSSTYRQSSAAREELNDIDPQNALLARQVRRRVEAEIVRDLALAVSGLLNRRVGGPSVRPPQPAEYSRLTYANSARWTTSPGDEKYRRGMYTFFQRTSPYPMLMTFDSPDSNIACTRRAESNTPLQALTLWNDPVFFECAQHFGRRIVSEIKGEVPSNGGAKGETDGEATVRRRLIHAFVVALSRQPDADEVEALADLYDEQLKLAASDEAGAAQLVGSAPVPPGVSNTELAAWIMVGRTLINLDEFITKE